MSFFSNIVNKFKNSFKQSIVLDKGNSLFKILTKDEYLEINLNNYEYKDLVDFNIKNSYKLKFENTEFGLIDLEYIEFDNCDWSGSVSSFYKSFLENRYEIKLDMVFQKEFDLFEFTLYKYKDFHLSLVTYNGIEDTLILLDQNGALSKELYRKVVLKDMEYDFNMADELIIIDESFLENQLLGDYFITNSEN